MPPATDRREVLADTAITLLAERGLHGLTHRGLDRAAAVPLGTSANYFRTRQELVMATARRMLENQLVSLEAVPRLASIDDIIAALVELARAGAGPARPHYLARAELLLEAGRNPELAALMRELRAVTVAASARWIHQVRPDVPLPCVDAMGAALTGVILDDLTLGGPSLSIEHIVTAIARGFLGEL